VIMKAKREQIEFWWEFLCIVLNTNPHNCEHKSEIQI
jgi:hypothetical protein